MLWNRNSRTLCTVMWWEGFCMSQKIFNSINNITLAISRPFVSPLRTCMYMCTGYSRWVIEKSEKKSKCDCSSCFMIMLSMAQEWGAVMGLQDEPESAPPGGAVLHSDLFISTAHWKDLIAFVVFSSRRMPHDSWKYHFATREQFMFTKCEGLYTEHWYLSINYWRMFF